MKVKIEFEVDLPEKFIVSEGGDKSILTKYEKSERTGKCVYLRSRGGGKTMAVTLQTAAYAFFKARNRMGECGIVSISD